MLGYRFYQPLGWLAIAALFFTEWARYQLPAPAAYTANQKLYWFVDHVFFNGKLLMLAMMAFVPARAGLNPRFLLAGGALLLMLGSFAKLSHPLYLAAAAVPFGVALKLWQPNEKMGLLLGIAGLAMGIPMNGFIGLLIVKAEFAPAVTRELLGSTAALGSLSIACFYWGLYLLTRLRRKSA
ncbi:MAG: hypothetical protein NW208_08520 [Bryobacter sp.]|nr:hypothetical protein [Bryobacter sp.]